MGFHLFLRNADQGMTFYPFIKVIPFSIRHTARSVPGEAGIFACEEVLVAPCIRS
jgi:hypothetical protein